MTPYGGTKMAQIARERDEALREVEELRDLLRKAWAFPNYPAGSEAEYDMLDEQIRKALDT